MLPVVLRNIFALTIAYPFFAGFAFFNIIIFGFLAANSFSVVLRYVSASGDFIIFWAHSAATFFARNLLFNATFYVIVARFIVAV